MRMIVDMNNAKSLAEAFISKNIDPPIDDCYQIIDSAIREDTEGWYFPFQSKRFIETRDMKFSVVGNWPVFVSKDGITVEQRRAIPNR
jgi:hypothetical protein